MGSDPISLGPFRLREVVGRGGMGEVWRGVHAASGVDVAVKVLTSAMARDDIFRASFRNEARAAASLDHPNVVGILDFGVIPVRHEALVPESPYLVMEWASGGTLSAAPAARSWSELRELLLGILGALGHAHARGVIHRDLKPGNVLLAGAGDARPGPKLADFGLARLADDPGKENVMAGTLQYMAPEQVLGMPRDEGPWTDLYALGCLAYRLASGRSPFRGPPKEIAFAQLHRPVPPLAALLAIPEGFPEWLGTLLEKDPRQRYRSAADAAWELERLGEAVESSGTQPIPLPPRSDPDALTSLATPPSMTAAMGDAEPEEIEIDTAQLVVQRERPPVPPTWRRGGKVAPAPRLPDTGLGVFGLRDIPLVGREEERDALWNELRRVAESDAAVGGARLVLLEGPSGCGKSRLARWLGERAYELGVATVHRVEHERDGLEIDGVAQMLARDLRCEGLDFAAALPRVTAALERQGLRDAEEAQPLAALVAPAGATVRFGGPSERHAIARRFLSREAAHRTVLVCIDDAQWSADALAFARHVLDASDRSPMLLVATVRDDVPEASAPALADLRARPDVTSLAIGPLPQDFRAALVRELLGLDGALAAAVEERTAGSPLFAVQLVGDWVQRGILEPTAHGFQLRDGAQATLPGDVGTVWQERIDGLLEGRPAAEGTALELAAILGHGVEPTLWEEVCAQAGVAAPWPLVDALLDQRLATADEHGPRAGWSFSHAMLREAIEQRARADGRLAAHHRCCAAALAARHGASPARLGRHLRAAGDDAGAIGPLLAAARARSEGGEVGVARMLLRECDEAMRAANVPESDVRWADLWSLGAINADGTDAALELAERVAEGARRFGWTRELADVRVSQARVLVRQAHPDRALELCREALATFESTGDRKGTWRALHWLGVATIECGDVAEARSIHRRALEAAREDGDLQAEADSRYELGIALREVPAEGRAHLETCLALNQRIGRAFGIANALLGLGELDREVGRFEAATERYEHALAVYERIGSTNALVARLNIGLAHLARGRWADARRTLEAARGPLERTGWRSMLACAHVEIAAACSGDGDWSGRDEHFGRAKALFAEGRVADPDLGWAASLAGELADRAGEAARAREAWELAREQWSALGREVELAAVDPNLERLRAVAG